MSSKKKLSVEESEALLQILKSRFQKNMKRHEGIDWAAVQTKLEANPDKLSSLNEMERTGGEPDIIFTEKEENKKISKFIFYDCSAESPKGRRNICYDREALNSRKEFKPKNSAIDMASEMGVELLNEEQYREIQISEAFDLKSSSWVKTPSKIRILGGALFCDRRYDTVFLYHNGAESYYAARGFRALLKL